MPRKRTRSKQKDQNMGQIALLDSHILDSQSNLFSQKPVQPANRTSIRVQTELNLNSMKNSCFGLKSGVTSYNSG